MNLPPVLFVVFRRPETTARVFEAIRSARPARLFIAADGPRPDRPDDVQACAQTRAIVSNVDWPCEVKTLFRDTNRGIKDGVADAITWFFEQVPEGIILEDDCLPHPDFFRFCAELLVRYRDDERVSQISGVNFQPAARTDTSYFFSRYNHVWGWASWARAWAAYDRNLPDLDGFLAGADKTGFWDSPQECTYWRKTFAWTKLGRVKTWDYQWKYTLWREGALCVYPERNLVTNIGFGAGATNTSEDSEEKAKKPLQELGELVPNPLVLRDRRADQYTFHHLYWGTPGERFSARWKRLLSLLRKAL